MTKALIGPTDTRLQTQKRAGRQQSNTPYKKRGLRYVNLRKHTQGHLADDTPAKDQDIIFLGPGVAVVAVDRTMNSISNWIERDKDR